MAVTVVVWNVETFGDNWASTRGVNYLPLCNLMAKVLYQVSADVLILMELRAGGPAFLPALRAALVNESGAAADGWEYDYIPGSVLGGVAYPVANAGQLGFVQLGHSEGYAVLWRDDHHDFDMLQTRLPLSGHPVHGDSNIGLVFQGRSSGPNPRPGVTGWYTAPNFNPAAPPAPWPELGFPEPNPITTGRARWDLVRRPCFVVLDLVRPGPPVPRAQELLPIVVHHATRGQRSTAWSVQAAGYSAPLYQVDDSNQAAPTMVTVNQAIAAGDYNVDHNDPNDVNWDAYTVFTTNFAGAGAGQGGANLPNTWVNSAVLPDNQTAVRLNQNGAPIIAGNVMAYRWLAIDNLFYRGLNPVLPAANYGGPVVDVLSGLLTGGWLVNTPAKQAVIQSFAAALAAALGPWMGAGFANYPVIHPVTATPYQQSVVQNGVTYYDGPVIGNLTNFIAYWTDLLNGHFSSPRRAAEFYFNSISDHLPVVLRFPV